MKRKSLFAAMLALALAASMVMTACGGAGSDKNGSESKEAVTSEADEKATDPAASGTDDTTPEGSGKKLIFVTTDVDGNEIDSAELFSRAEYTMVNCWASWCGPCVREMPEIEQMSGDFASRGGQVVGILMNGNTAGGLSDGRAVIERTGVTYLNIVSNEDIDSQVDLFAYPTTFFVDSAGTVVGEPIVGAIPESYISTMNGLLGK